MRILALLHDSFGGHGGVAQFNRHFLTAAAGAPDTQEVVALPRLVPSPPGPLPARLTFDLRAAGSKGRYAVAALRAVLLGGRFDVVVCGHLRLLWLGFLAARLARAPLVLIVHGIDAWTPGRSALVNRLVRRVDAVLSVSEFTKQKLLGWAGLPDARVRVVPPAVNPGQFGPGPRDPALLARYKLDGKAVILTLARLVGPERRKGVDEVLDCLPALLRRRPDLVYLVAGDGSDRPRLEAKARRLGIATHVVFCGRVAEAEKADHYRLADAFVMPGRTEGFGIVYLEAIACGVPVVGSKLDGSRDALRDGRLGILVDPRDPDEVGAGILAALERPKGVPEGLDDFHFDCFARRVRDLLAAVAPRAGRRSRAPTIRA